MSLKTLENLVIAYISESVARNKYIFYAKIAKNEGYIFISKVFLETAENEKEHAETLLELIQELRGDKSDVNVEIRIPIVLGNTIDNLRNSIEGEKYEHTKMYPEFAKIAEEEGLKDVAARLKAIAEAEKHHEMRFKVLLSQIKDGTMFKRETEIEWVCLECGYIHKGREPPENCPSCGHPKNYYVAKDMLCL